MWKRITKACINIFYLLAKTKKIKNEVCFILNFFLIVSTMVIFLHGFLELKFFFDPNLYVRFEFSLNFL